MGGEWESTGAEGGGAVVAYYGRGEGEEGVVWAGALSPPFLLPRARELVMSCFVMLEIQRDAFVCFCFSVCGRREMGISDGVTGLLGFRFLGEGKEYIM